MGRRKKVIEVVEEKATGWIDGAMPEPVSMLPTAPDPKPTQEPKADIKVKTKKTIPEKPVRSGYFEKPNYNGFSFLEALRIMKVDSTFLYRKKIAEANGIDNYLGLGKDNKELLEKLVKGDLKMP